MIRDWPVWTQMIVVLGWCGGMGALGGYLVGWALNLARPPGRHRYHR